jgi:hypothetical protein
MVLLSNAAFKYFVLRINPLMKSVRIVFSMKNHSITTGAIEDLIAVTDTMNCYMHTVINNLI